MKKIVLSVFVIILFVAHVTYERLLGSNIIVPIITSESTSSKISNKKFLNTLKESSKESSGQSTPNNFSNTVSPVLSEAYKDGQYAGSSTDAYYGNVQVKAVIQKGKIIDVQVLDYPKDRVNSIEINIQAMPMLKTEAIQAQSAKVDIISGATQTSTAFEQSLQSALDQAKI